MDQDYLDSTEPSESSFTGSLNKRKHKLYDKLPIDYKQANIIVWVAGILLGVVVVLIILEACGVFSLFPKLS